MHVLGNDFVIVDLRDGRPLPSKDKIALLSDRHMGIGCDQFITIEKPKNKKAKAFMRILNADGSEAEACGNATRCVANILIKESRGRPVTVETVAGLLECSAADGLGTGDMGVP